MLALSLIQPYASLIACGHKQFETRSWQTRYRGPLAIHASARITFDARLRCSDEPFRTALRDALTAGGVAAPGSDVDLWKRLPVGAILAVGRLVDCVRVESLIGPPRHARLTEREEAFGDYTPGRWAWLIGDVRPLPEPIPARGRLGLWKTSTDVQARIRASLGDVASF